MPLLLADVMDAIRWQLEAAILEWTKLVSDALLLVGHMPHHWHSAQLGAAVHSTAAQLSGQLCTHSMPAALLHPS